MGNSAEGCADELENVAEGVQLGGVRGHEMLVHVYEDGHGCDILCASEVEGASKRTPIFDHCDLGSAKREKTALEKGQ